MTAVEARKIIGTRQPTWAIRNMRKALELHPWRNTPGEWQRLEACYTLARTPTKKRVTR
jgi:hypothetical protein